MIERTNSYTVMITAVFVSVPAVCSEFLCQACAAVFNNVEDLNQHCLTHPVKPITVQPELQERKFILEFQMELRHQ